MDGNPVMLYSRRYVCATPKLCSASECLSLEGYSFLNSAIKVVENRKTIPQKYRNPINTKANTDQISQHFHGGI
jgi:hypothetical protein